MIGSSLPLCYPQIGPFDLLYFRALCLVRLLTKHIRLGVRTAFFEHFPGFGGIPFRRRLYPLTPSG